jgi:hypothetical protein
LFFQHYEMIFIRQLIADKDFTALSQFKFTLRWTDDILTLHNDPNGLLQKLQAIYPDYLTLNLEQCGKRVAWCDWSIKVKAKNSAGCSLTGHYTTSVHDKRFEPRFASVPVVKGMHPSADMIWRAKEGSLLGEFSRYRDICNHKRAFTFASAKLMFEMYCKGYSYLALRRLALKAVRPARLIYGTTYRTLIRIIENRFAGLCRTGLSYLEHPLALPYYPANRTLRLHW